MIFPSPGRTFEVRPGAYDGRPVACEAGLPREPICDAFLPAFPSCGSWRIPSVVRRWLIFRGKPRSHKDGTVDTKDSCVEILADSRPRASPNHVSKIEQK